MKIIDHAYAFAPPHRVTVCMPNAKHKLLADALEDRVKLSWTDEDPAATYPPGPFHSMNAGHMIEFTASVDGEPLRGSRWSRVGGFLPSMDYLFERGSCSLRFEVTPYAGGEIIRLTASNTGGGPARITLSAFGGSAYGLQWAEPENPFNALLAHCGATPDRIFLLSLSAPPARGSGWMTMACGWELGAGESEVSYMLTPTLAYIDDAEHIIGRDWAAERERGIGVWRELLARGAAIDFPDKALENVYLSCLCDMFVMRDEQFGGGVAGVPGTEIYRAPNPVEPVIQTLIFNRAGYGDESYENLAFLLGGIEPDGDWCDKRRWAHHMWCVPGFKARGALDYYKHCPNRQFLERAFERMYASSRWIDHTRKTTKVPFEGERPLNWGLMPRGMGDGGLRTREDDIFGVFYPHNFYCCASIAYAIEAARMLGRGEDIIAELTGWYEDYMDCITTSLEKGAIDDPAGYRWIPGSPADPSGSHWNVIDAAEPLRLFPLNHPLIEGTLRLMAKNISAGGLPRDLGWMEDGLWVAIAIDSLSHAHLARGEGQIAVDYLYAAANHASYFDTWCEERMPEPGTTVKTGDLQHSWTPTSFCLLFLEMLASSDGEGLRLCRGLDPEWLAEGKRISVERLNTHWGPVSFTLGRENGSTARLTLSCEGDCPPEVTLDLSPLTDAIRCAEAAGACCEYDGRKIRLTGAAKEVIVTISL